MILFILCLEAEGRKTDVIVISNDGGRMDEALLQADKAAQYRELEHRDALHLRLLTEETLGMMRAITGQAEGSFWIESDGNDFRICLKVVTYVDFDKREKLLAASTSGKNEAARGIMGRIRAFFDPLDSMPVPMDLSAEGMSSDLSWSMNAYRADLQAGVEANREGAARDWDELEKSVVTHIADEVKVSIRGREVKMTIYKKMG